MNTKKIKEALDLQNDVIERLRKIINKTHPEPIEATTSLALVCKCYKEALEELERSES